MLSFSFNQKKRSSPKLPQKQTWKTEFFPMILNKREKKNKEKKKRLIIGYHFFSYHFNSGTVAS